MRAREGVNASERSKRERIDEVDERMCVSVCKLEMRVNEQVHEIDHSEVEESGRADK